VYRLFCISAFCISAFCSWLLAFCHIGFLSYRLFVLSAYWYRLFDRRLIPLGFSPRILDHQHPSSRPPTPLRATNTPPGFQHLSGPSPLQNTTPMGHQPPPWRPPFRYYPHIRDSPRHCTALTWPPASTVGFFFAANFIQNLYTVLKKRLWESRSTPTLVKPIICLRFVFVLSSFCLHFASSLLC
jgi:hypothetical protein